VAWVLDLDGVVWLVERAIPGAPEAVAMLRSAGERVVFVTNNSSKPAADVAAALAAMGVPGGEDDVVTSAEAAATLLAPGERAMVLGGVGVVRALEARGVETTVDGDGRADAVVVGLTRELTYDRLAAAATAVRDGARLIATNADATLPTAGGPLPGAGSILAAVVTASGATPTVAGKPHEPMAAAVRERLGPGRHWVAGDRPETDGRFATAIGARFALVLTGVTAEADLPVDPEPDLVAPDLAAAVRAVLDGGG
jgi:HAD superfamily hydrolase (TIGR01450 family)